MAFVLNLGVVDAAIAKVIIAASRSGTPVRVIIPIQANIFILRCELAMMRCPLGRVRLEQVMRYNW